MTKWVSVVPAFVRQSDVYKRQVIYPKFTYKVYIFNFRIIGKLIYLCFQHIFAKQNIINLFRLIKVYIQYNFIRSSSDIWQYPIFSKTLILPPSAFLPVSYTHLLQLNLTVWSRQSGVTSPRIISNEQSL